MQGLRLTRWDVTVALSLIGLLVAHYTVPAHAVWIHIVLFWLFQIPVLIGGATRGVRGGLATAIFITVALSPHVLGLNHHHHGLSANAIWMDLVSLYIIGALTGWLRDQWRRQAEHGEKIRDLENLGRLLTAFRRDLCGPAAGMRGHLVSLEPLQRRTPALIPAVREMSAFLRSLEMLADGLGSLRIDQRIRLVPLDAVIAATEAHLQRIGAPVPTIRVLWQCKPPSIPASVVSIGAALATLIMRFAGPPEETSVTIMRRPGWVVLDLRARGTAPYEGAVPPYSPAGSYEMACQVIRAHGGFVENRSPGFELSLLRVGLPAFVRVRVRSGAVTDSRSTNFVETRKESGALERPTGRGPQAARLADHPVNSRASREPREGEMPPIRKTAREGCLPSTSLEHIGAGSPMKGGLVSGHGLRTRITRPDAPKMIGSDAWEISDRDDSKEGFRS